MIRLHRRGEEGEEFWLNVLLVERVYGDLDTFLTLSDGQHLSVGESKDEVLSAIRSEQHRIFAPSVRAERLGGHSA